MQKKNNICSKRYFLYLLQNYNNNYLSLSYRECIDMQFFQLFNKFREDFSSKYDIT